MGMALPLLACLLIAPFGALQSAESRPNIVLIVADDMGYGDLGFNGSTLLKTPNLDSLAANGVFCTRGYVTSAVCSPSRAGLITGRDPRRFGYEGNMIENSGDTPTRAECLGLPPHEHTLADHLKAAGYRTALVGKWHLGDGGIFHPNRRGFDYFCGMLNGSHGYFPTPENNRLERNGVKLSEFSSPYLTDFFTDEAVAWIDRASSQAPKEPFFLYLAYNAPHGPLEATREDLDLFLSIQDKKRRTYAAMVHALDRGVGRVIDCLQKQNQTTNTLVVFFSDNGGATNNASWNGPLSGAKGCLLEGGVRVPMIWSWPGTLPGGKHYNTPVSSLDLLPTFLAAAGAKPLPLGDPMPYEDKANRRHGCELYGDYDGINVLPLLRGDSKPPERTLFWRLQGQRAVLHGDDKLIVLSHRPAQLFQPGSDPGERKDLSTIKAPVLGDLFKRLGEWESSMPTPPLWDCSPRWIGNSATIYDSWAPRSEPR